MFPTTHLDAPLRLRARGPAKPSTSSRRPIVVAVFAAVLCLGLVWSERWQSAAGAAGTFFPNSGAANGPRADLQWLAVLVKLGAAGLIGLLVTTVQRFAQRERPLPRSMEQAQTLLCVAGAMMMIIIGDSLARAFGIAGAAAIVRFRTPVDDPRDTTVLFLLLALGMAAGIGALSLAGLGALCLCVLLPALDRFSDPIPRTATVECVARGAVFPADHVHAVFAQHAVAFEPREVEQGEAGRVLYHATMRPETSLQALTAELLADPALGSVSWDVKRKA